MITQRVGIFQIFLSLLFLLISGLSWSQAVVADSLKNLYEQASTQSEKLRLLNEITYNHCFFDPKTGIDYGKQAIELSKEFEKTDLSARAYLNTAIAYHLMEEKETTNKL